MGWLLYDAGNSAYATTVAVGVLPAFFAGVIVGPTGIELFGHTVSATSLWGAAVGFAALMLFCLAPILGALADRTHTKKRFLMAFCLLGVASTLGLSRCGPGDVGIALTLFVAAQIGFNGGNAFYDAFLPHIASQNELDIVSGKGFAWGYIGGGVQFGLALGLIAGHDALGLTMTEAAGWAMASAGLWWLAFASGTFFLLPEPDKRTAPHESRCTSSLIRQEVAQALRHGRRIMADPTLRRFIIAFFFFNDGVQTTISMATIYGKEELGLSNQTLMITLLIIQFVAFVGAMLFGRLGARIGTIRALSLTLVIWLAVAGYAAVLSTSTQYIILGMVVGLVLGGSQSLARSLYAALIPQTESAGYFGFFSVFNKFSAILGPFAFALIRQVTGSSRPAVLVLFVFFLLGLFFLRRIKSETLRPTTHPHS